MRVTEFQIESSFGLTTAYKGFEYAMEDRVDEVVEHETRATGLVDGGRRQPYETSIFFSKPGQSKRITSSCTCPVGANCKHGAALAYFIAWRFHDEQPTADKSEPKEPDYRLPETDPSAAEIAIPSEIESWLQRVRAAASDPAAEDPNSKKRLFYRLETERTREACIVPILRNRLKSGGWGSSTDIKFSTTDSYSKPAYWTAQDRQLLADLSANATKRYASNTGFILHGRYGARLLSELIATGKLEDGRGEGISLGEPQRGVFSWTVVGAKGFCEPRLTLERGVLVNVGSPWYFDRLTHECGPVECNAPPAVVMALIETGPVPAEHLEAIKEQIEAAQVPAELLPPVPYEVHIRCPKIVPCLKVELEACKSVAWLGDIREAPLAFAHLWFEYEGHRAPVNGEDVRVLDQNSLTVLRRNSDAEKSAVQMLKQTGWSDAKHLSWDIPNGRKSALARGPDPDGSPLAAIEWVSKFSESTIPKLRDAGWMVNVDATFNFFPETSIEWEVGLESPPGVDWFEFKLGISVEGEPIALQTLLRHLGKVGTDLAKVLAPARRGESDELFVFGLDGRSFNISRRRLAALVEPLLELFGSLNEWPEELKLSRALAPITDRLQDAALGAGVEWRSTAELTELIDKLASFDRLAPVAEPEGFVGTLREYQREGLAWLQFLRQFGFGGILADDMGLGKTVQIIAHLVSEKLAGRMDRPCLIVAPTTTLPNWEREFVRFAPNLKVLNLRGSGRANRFDGLEEADVGLTTYPLLSRDQSKLGQREYHLLILDEAQNIKNAVTGAAKAARNLSARHRVCLSGTPVENHLGELWSLFHFLMPGFLRSEADFRKRFRTPIEKLANREAQAQLAKRVRPFMLRRTKAQVAKELPPKTEMVETVELEDSQRDLYESIRSTMDARVRDLIASQGLDHSRIQILDALLKLRQVCCDPRLVKLPSAKAVTESAKLTRVVEMLTVLLEEGRKILLFSQFTSMLDLIEQRLREESITWVRISGDTEDRDTPVQSFQSGEVSLFLISLKAGGTGLNLTAADTVILYDPWWNPAVENQAIDRAHRIGQDKPVLVYKMVVASTIEEKMLEMQARKGDLARNILTDEEGFHALTAQDLQWILAR